MSSQQNIYTNTLDHLPLAKQEELTRMVELIRSESEVEMLILFGSYATGKWVEDMYVEDGTTYEYKSDVDILAVTKAKKEYGDRALQRASDAIRKHPGLGIASIIHHSIHFLNEKISHQYYFYIDVYREGVLLYDSGHFKLSPPRPIRPKVRLKKAQEEFDYWFKKGEEFMIDSQNATKRESFEIAAFYLHQSTESYYIAFLLVFTDYRPKTHDLVDLGSRASKIDKAMQPVFPCRTQEEKDLFDLLRRAYVDARYRKDYTITSQELQYLSERVLLLRALTEQLCKEEMQRLKEAIGGAS
ncbi:MAG: HEPN domain-containing protein [Roseivirga sp.]